MSFTDSVLLVTGAGGQLGGQAIEALLQRGARRVVAASRDPGKLAALAARGVETRRADFDDPASLAKAFAGIERLLLVSTDQLGEPGRRLKQHRAAVAAAVQAGVRHVVYTSAPVTYPTPGGSLTDDHFWTEAALAESGAASRIPGWTFLRNQLYADLLLQSLSHAIAGGQLFSATGGAGRNFVTRADCAAAAAGALLTAEGKRIHDITGPAPVTYDALAALAGEIAGRKVRHVAVPPAVLGEGLAKAGLPGFLVEALVAFDVDASRGHHAIVSPSVAELTGRAPTALPDFLRANAAALRAH